MASSARTSTFPGGLPAPRPLTRATVKPLNAKATETTLALSAMRVVHLLCRGTPPQRQASDIARPDFAQPAQIEITAGLSNRKVHAACLLSIVRMFTTRRILHRVPRPNDCGSSQTTPVSAAPARAEA